MENPSSHSPSPSSATSFSSQQEVIPLPHSVEQLITKICLEQKQDPLRFSARSALKTVGEETALNILKFIASQKIQKTFDGFVLHLVRQKNSNNSINSSPIKSPPPTSSSSSSSFSTKVAASKRLCFSPTLSPKKRVAELASPQLEALGELDFRKAFLILSYLGRCRLEDEISVDEIRKLNGIKKMDKFEAEVWKQLGWKCGYIKEEERRKYIDWDSGKTHVYHCHVYSDGSYLFKGPFLVPKRNFLQRALGDDNVLLVKFAEEVASTNNACKPWDNYMRVAREGIVVGLRRYRFFVFKDGGKEEKKKDPTTSQVKCYFVRMESHAFIDKEDYILHKKTVREARSLFMHADSLSSLPSYMARFSLILSKTERADIDLSTVDIRCIDDEPCRDVNGNLVKDKDDKLMIHTDGTGFISEDLALECLKSLQMEKCGNTDILDKLLDSNESMLSSPVIKFPRAHSEGMPLLIQFRLFHKGRAVKGTVLVNKMLPPRTICIRPSMIKVKIDESRSDMPTLDSLEIVGTSKRPKKVYLSKYLIALLSYGGVTQEYFMEILRNALDDTQNALSNKHAALRVALNHGDFDDLIVARMIWSGIPLEESYLQYRLSMMAKLEKKGLRDGKIPISESYYLMGTADPTGLLEDGEVCVILDNGQVSGKVLVYRNPGLHFGDIHVLKATYVDALQQIVGNSKYAIFFPCKGPRSLADEIAGGDFDGDMYFVSRNPQLLEMFKQEEPWTSISPSYKITNNEKPSELSDEELEHKLFELFLTSRFNPSYTVSLAADSWLTIMDQLLTRGDEFGEEKARMRGILSQLVDIYYDALDAPKKGGRKIELHYELKADVFPHYMEKQEMTYKSTSILGSIYDTVRLYEEEDPPSSDIRKFPCFDDEVPESCRTKWEELYRKYRPEMKSAVDDKQDNAANEVIKKYKQELYDAPELEESKKSIENIFQEALALYDIAYSHAQKTGIASYCSFAWRVAGSALFKLYMLKNGDQIFTGSLSVAREILGVNR